MVRDRIEERGLAKTRDKNKEREERLTREATGGVRAIVRSSLPMTTGPLLSRLFGGRVVQLQYFESPGSEDRKRENCP